MHRVGVLFATTLGMAFSIIGALAILWNVKQHLGASELGVLAFALLGMVNYAATLANLLRLRREVIRASDEQRMPHQATGA
jgi:hypothetical protein